MTDTFHQSKGVLKTFQCTFLENFCSFFSVISVLDMSLFFCLCKEGHLTKRRSFATLSKSNFYFEALFTCTEHLSGYRYPIYTAVVLLILWVYFCCWTMLLLNDVLFVVVVGFFIVQTHLKKILMIWLVTMQLSCHVLQILLIENWQIFYFLITNIFCTFKPLVSCY